MKYLCIANKGLIEIEALTLVGASSKRNGHNYIGMFGSGNKYALSYFLRNNYNIHLYSGQDKIELETKPTSFRDENFDVIYVNKQKTSITTQMGHKWELWQAVRELYANAVDEGLLHFDFVDEINPEDSNTHLYIESTPELENFMFNIQDYIAKDKTIIFENETGKIYKKHSDKSCIYRKGIRCYETKQPTLFDYDFNEVDINESRVAIHDWEIKEKMWTLLANCTIPQVAYEVLNRINEKDFLENSIDHLLVSTSTSEFSEAWKKPLQDRNICPMNMGGYLDESEKAKTYLLPNTLYNHLLSLTENKTQPDSFKVAGTTIYKEIENLDDNIVKTLEKVYDFIVDTKLPINYKWKVVNFGNKNVHGTIDKDKQLILLGAHIFESGTQHVLNVIIEEYAHLKYNAPDESRMFQKCIIDEYISYAQQVSNNKL